MRIETRNWAGDRTIVTVLGDAPVNEGVQLVTAATTYQVTENDDGTLEVRNNEGGAMVITPVSGNAMTIDVTDHHQKPLVTNVRRLQALPAGTKLYSKRTTHFWTWNGMEADHNPVVATGTGGGYTYAADFISHESPLQIMHTPADGPLEGPPKGIKPLTGHPFNCP